MELKLALLKTLAGENWKQVAMNKIWQKYYKPVTYYIVNCFKVNEQGEDLVQEIMFKIYNNLESFNPKFSLNTYIYTIARNHCIDYLKKRKTVTINNYYEHEDKNTGSLEKNYLEQELEEKVTKVLNTFSNDYKEIAFLRFFVKKSYKDITTITGESLQTVKNRIYKVRQTLKKELKEYL